MNYIIKKMGTRRKLAEPSHKSGRKLSENGSLPTIQEKKSQRKFELSSRQCSEMLKPQIKSDMRPKFNYYQEKSD